MTATSTALKKIYSAARPLIADGLDIAEQIAALRDTATNDGLDWSQIKALLKAQIQDERDENGDGKRVKRLLEKADHATAYADMLGLANMNENNFSAEVVEGDDPFPPHDPVTGEITDIENRTEKGAPHLVPSGAAGENATAAAMSAGAPAAINPESPQDDPPVPSLAGEVADAGPIASATDPEFDIGNVPAFLRRTPANDARVA
jgi:hypothetical protein